MPKPTAQAMRAARAVIGLSKLVDVARDIDRATRLPALIEALKRCDQDMCGTTATLNGVSDEHPLPQNEAHRIAENLWETVKQMRAALQDAEGSSDDA